MYATYRAKAPTIRALQWFPERGVHPEGLRIVNNGFDDAYALIDHTHYAWGAGGAVIGAPGDYLVTTIDGTLFFVPRARFESRYEPVSGLDIP